MPRKVYLEDIPLDEARRRFDEALARAGALAADRRPSACRSARRSGG